MTTAIPGPRAVPRLRPGVRLAPDPAAGDEALLFPEGVVLLNETAGAVLHRCDGVASVERIIRGLGREYDGVAPEDVQAVLRWLAERRLLEVDGG